MLSGAAPPWERPSLLVGAFALLMLLIVYRRLRRQFGAQPLQPMRLGVRIAVLFAVGLALLPVAARSFTSIGVGLLGLGAGVALGKIAAARTRFTRRGDALDYIPHTATGVLVSALLLLRLGMRFARLYSGVSSVPPGAGFAPALQELGPLTVGLLFLLVGYYVYYYSRVLWKSRHLEPGDLDPPTAPP